MNFNVKKKNLQVYHQNEVVLYRSGSPFFNELKKRIKNAQSSIHLQTYILTNDVIGSEIINLLCNAATIGVKVYVCLDAFGSANLPLSVIEKMKESGIHFKWFGRLIGARGLHLGRRLHRKLFIVDHQFALVGGINISDNYANELNPWLDYAVGISGDSIKQLIKIASQRWPEFYFAPVKTYHGNQKLQIAENDRLRNKNQIGKSYAKIIKQSVTEIIIAGGYFLPGLSMRKALTQAARSGCSVKILVSSKSDVGLVYYARQYLYNYFLKNGIALYEYEPANVHAKVIVGDGNLCSIGSFDLNNLSTYSNIELNVNVLDSSFSKAIQLELLQQINSSSRPVKLHLLNSKIKIWQKIRNAVAYRIVKVLFQLSGLVAAKSEDEYQ